jgi:hypothetical protein
MPNIDQIRELLTKAIEEASAKGWRLVSECFGDPPISCACPLGCYMLQRDHGIDYDDPEQRAAKLLGVSIEWIRAFYLGFDEGVPLKSVCQEAYDLGVEFHRKYEPTPHDQFCEEKDEAQTSFELDDD